MWKGWLDQRSVKTLMDLDNRYAPKGFHPADEDPGAPKAEAADSIAKGFKSMNLNMSTCTEMGDGWKTKSYKSSRLRRRVKAK